MRIRGESVRVLEFKGRVWEERLINNTRVLKKENKWRNWRVIKHVTTKEGELGRGW